MSDSRPTDSSLPVLYSFRRCPYAIRARMAIAASEIRVALREVALREKPQELLAASPKGTVPVLVLPQGEVIEESLEVMDWALSLNDPQGWLLLEDEARRQYAKKLIEENDSFFKPTLDGYKYPEQHPDRSAMAHREQGEIFLEKLNHRLTEADYLVGPRASLADIAIFPFVRQFAQVDRDWFDEARYQRLKIWLDAFVDSELFRRVMIKVDPWVPGSPVLSFPSQI
jgi:glutathione S-transferase